MSPWIPRKRRENRNLKLVSIAIWVLALAFVIFAIIRFAAPFKNILKGQTSSKTAISSKIKSAAKPTRASIDSLFIRAFGELGLQQINFKKMAEDSLGRPYRYSAYAALWPETYPFVWFTQKIQANCRCYDSLYYDALEYAKGKNLIAILTNGHDTLGRIELTASNKPVAPAFSMAFVFEKIGRFRTDQIQRLIQLKIPFGFTLNATEFIDKTKIAALRSSKGQCILEIPTDEGSWKPILASKTAGKRNQNQPYDSNMLNSAISQFPHLAGFYFNEKNGVDRDLAKAIIGILEKRSITYFYEKKEPGFVDSMTYANGLKIATFATKIDCRSQNASNCRKSILARSNILTSEDKGVFILDASTENLDILISIADLLNKLNIEIVPPLAKTRLVEKL